MKTPPLSVFDLERFQCIQTMITTMLSSYLIIKLQYFFYRLMRANEDLEVKTVGLQLHEKAEEKKACCGRWMLTIILLLNLQKLSVKKHRHYNCKTDNIYLKGTRCSCNCRSVAIIHCHWLIFYVVVVTLIAMCTTTYCMMYTNLLQGVH